MWRTVGGTVWRTVRGIVRETMWRIVGRTVSRTVRQTVPRDTLMTTIHAKVVVRFVFGLPDWTFESPRSTTLFKIQYQANGI